MPTLRSPTLHSFSRQAAASALLLALVACGDTAKLTVAEGSGPQPMLPEPNKTLIPTVRVAKATGWPAGGKPTPAPGWAVSAYATELQHPRWLYVLPNGDVLVAESDAPAKPADDNSLRGWIMKKFMRLAGSGGSSADRITLLRDANGDGVPEMRSVLLENLHSPFGMALIGNTLYVANTDAIVKFPYQPGQTRITAEGEMLTALPGGPINHHWTKNILASPDGKTLYVTVGSNSNVGENGMDQEVDRAAIHTVDVASGQRRLFASGLRNPNGLAWQPQSGVLWTVVNERDELGSDLVPDYLTSVQKGGFYGWPYSYYGRHVDARAQPPRPDLVAQALVPDYALGPHVAALGLTFYTGQLFPARYRNGAFIGEHGSWNRRPPSGYRVVFVPFAEGKPADLPEEVLVGFLSGEGEAYGRPVGVAVDRSGALLVADDVGGAVWRVPPASSASGKAAAASAAEQASKPLPAR